MVKDVKERKNLVPPIGNDENTQSDHTDNVQMTQGNVGKLCYSYF